jgi:uncharacterized protein (TIGR04255 family)
MSWKTINPEHAIERVRFEVLFSDDIPPKMLDGMKRSFEARRADIRFGEIQKQTIHNILVGSPDSARPLLQESSGWQSARRRSTNKPPVEAVIVDSKSLVYESTEYHGWTKTKKRFERVCGDILHSVLEIMNLESFSHDYTDRFVYGGEPEAADAKWLLASSLLSAVTSEAAKGKQLWHVHRGWFQNEEDWKVLINQNLDVQEGTTKPGQKVRSIQIYTKAEAKLHGVEIGQESIENLVNRLHVCCSMTFATALTENGRALLGINLEGVGGNA